MAGEALFAGSVKLRKGYAAEYLAKKILLKTYGIGNVIKVAIGGAQDYIIVKKGRLLKIVEIKECHAKKYYPKPREVEQLERMKIFANEHQCGLEVWIKYPHKEFQIESHLPEPDMP